MTQCMPPTYQPLGTIEHLNVLSTQASFSNPVAVHLAGGSSEAEGRVEVYINGKWGTVCSWRWDPLDGKVVCRQLGYKGVNRTFSEISQHGFDEGTGQCWLSDLRCTGSEANLLQCPHHGVGSYEYLMATEAHVVCTNKDLPDEGEFLDVHRSGERMFEHKSHGRPVKQLLVKSFSNTSNANSKHDIFLYISPDLSCMFC